MVLIGKGIFADLLLEQKLEEPVSHIGGGRGAEIPDPHGKPGAVPEKGDEAFKAICARIHEAEAVVFSVAEAPEEKVEEIRRTAMQLLGSAGEPYFRADQRGRASAPTC